MDYEVGYGKPPLHTRFRKGQSGNPAGRPRRPKNFAAVLRRALDRRAPAVQGAPPGTPLGTPLGAQSAGGGRRRVTWREAVVAGLFERSVAGDFRATRLLIDLMCRLEPPAVDPDPADEEEDPREFLIRELDRLAGESDWSSPDANPPKDLPLPPGGARQEP
jgi:hypothetical protein